MERGSPESDLFTELDEVDLTRRLLADLHDGLRHKLARARQLTDLTSTMGPSGTILPGGEVTITVWQEAQWSFIHGFDIATVVLCQGLMEHVLAAYLQIRQLDENLPARISFTETLKRCRELNILNERDEADLRKLMMLRNPLSHFRAISDPSSLSARVLSSRLPSREHLNLDANFSIGLAVRILASEHFRLG